MSYRAFNWLWIIFPFFLCGKNRKTNGGYKKMRVFVV
ncbi:hypothetical protein SLEP1_g3570 [Rubroshorea leprosula]|uniref:Uncharacterized protein n=1 Tax=Rubroshorea leprosula TaxID=152421 RepID=A0AAV5HLD3_9ROSI|nr:hypothetical protein SLEP1_g3570 [Rubroshorea leprosula]